MAILFNHENNFKNYLMYGKRQYMKSKNVVYEQGDMGEGFYYLDSGLIKVIHSTPLGRTRVKSLCCQVNYWEFKQWTNKLISLLLLQ